MKVSINRTRFNQMMQRAGELFQEKLAEESQKMLTEERRPFPRPTTRSDGSVATSPRDVVDTGELVNSFQTNIKQSGSHILISQEWLAEHAALVYLGWTSVSGNDIPPWRWMQELEQYVNLEQLFAECCEKARREIFG